MRAPLAALLTSAIVIIVIAHAEQLLSLVPNITQRQAPRPRAAFAFLGFILREHRGRWGVGFVVQGEQLRAEIIVRVRAEVE